MHEYEKRLYFSNSGIRPVVERVNPEDSRSLYLIKMSDENWVDAVGVVFPKMEERTDEPIERWKYTDPDGHSEYYDPQGRLIKETDSQGRETTLTYVDNRLAQVSNWKGQTLDFSYSTNGVLESVTDSLGRRYRYQFNEDGLLTSVTFPDETPDNLADNPTRRYRYEHEPIPHALTSIVDENGQVAASWTYDDSGRAISSSHAGGADTTTFSYGAGSTTVTNPLGKETTYHYGVVENAHGAVLKNVNVIQHVEGHPSTYCAGANTNYEYNSDGYVTQKRDWNGNETRYRRDAQGRELSRTEGYSTDESRTITTTWDESLEKPLVVTEPGRITEYSYGDDGRVLSKTQRDAAD
jgi:YD repeat-containing protein